MEEMYGTYAADKYFETYGYDDTNDGTDDDTGDDKDHKKDSYIAGAAPTHTRPGHARPGQTKPDTKHTSCLPCFGMNGHQIGAVKF